MLGVELIACRYPLEEGPGGSAAGGLLIQGTVRRQRSRWKAPVCASGWGFGVIQSTVTTTPGAGCAGWTQWESSGVASLDAATPTRTDRKRSDGHRFEPATPTARPGWADSAVDLIVKPSGAVPTMDFTWAQELLFFPGGHA